MKKSLLLISALALAWLLTSCKKKDDAPLTETTFKASIEKSNGNALKTALDPSNGNVLWNEGDKIRVYNGNEETAVFTLTDGAGTTEGMFATSEAFEMIPPFKVVYPFDASYDGSKATFELPDTQSITDIQSFEKGIFPMIAYSSDNNLSFKNLCGGLGIRLKGLGAHVSSIRLTSKKTDDKLSGIYEIADITAANPELTPASSNSASNSITINCDITLTTAAKCFYIVLPTGTLSEGFTIDVYDGNELLISKETTSDLATVERNTMKCLNEVPINVEMDGNVDLPDNMSCSNIVISNLTETAIPDENGDFVIGYSKTLMARNVNNGKLIYFSVQSVDNDIKNSNSSNMDYELNAKETAIFITLRFIPYSMFSGRDDAFRVMKETLYSLQCVKNLENKISETVYNYGYLELNSIAEEIQAVKDFIISEVMSDMETTSSKNSFIRKDINWEIKEDRSPYFPVNIMHGTKVVIESAKHYDNPDHWNLNCTCYNGIAAPLGIVPGFIDYDTNEFDESETQHMYFLFPSTLSRVYDIATLGDWDGLRDLIANSNQAFNLEGDMTFEKFKLEDVCFDVDQNVNILGFISPSDDDRVMFCSALCATLDILSVLIPFNDFQRMIYDFANDPELIDIFLTEIHNGNQGINRLVEQIWIKVLAYPFEYSVQELLSESINALTGLGTFAHCCDFILNIVSSMTIDSFGLPIASEYNAFNSRITTTPAKYITYDYAQVGGNIWTNMDNISERGVCFSSVTEEPTINNTCVLASVPGRSFWSDLEDLEEGTIYYARAYYKEGSNVHYGQPIVFTTLDHSIPTEGLVAYYPFNGNANDACLGMNDGQIIGNVILTSDRKGNENSAYLFPGEPFNYISIPDCDDFHLNTFTLNAWVYSDDDYANGYLINKGRDIVNGSFHLTVRDVCAEVEYGGVNTAYLDENPEIGKWHMITGTVAGSYVRFYVDGVLMDDRQLSHEYTYDNNDPLTFGMHYYDGVPDYWAYPLKGVLDDIRIYNRALSEQEIRELYRE